MEHDDDLHVTSMHSDVERPRPATGQRHPVNHYFYLSSIPFYRVACEDVDPLKIPPSFTQSSPQHTN